MPNIRLSDAARAFVRREARYLAERDRRAAEGFLDRLREAQRNLSRFPEIGRSSPLPLEGLRRLVVGDYLLDYDLSPGGVEIVAIRHGRQADPFVENDPTIDFEADPE